MEAAAQTLVMLLDDQTFEAAIHFRRARLKRVAVYFHFNQTIQNSIMVAVVVILGVCVAARRGGRLDGGPDQSPPP